jgi:thiamine pyrophosphokinase
VGGEAHGVTTHRLQYPLTDATLVPGSTWGVSNVLLEPTARVTVASGTVLSVQPNALEH